MAIKYSPALNLRLRNDVRNYNKRIKRAEAKGLRNLPPLLKVRDIKALYTDRRQLERELNRIESLNRKDLTNRYSKKGGARGLDWQFEFVKSNQIAAKEYFTKEYGRVNAKVSRFPGERTYLDTISSKIDMLSKNINDASESQFRSMLSATIEFQNSPELRRKSYRGFLSEVDWVMDQTGISQEQRDKFFKKFEQLTPTQFLYAYDNNDIINKIYSLYRKDFGAEEAVLTDPENAEELIRQLMSEADEIVNDAKLNSL